MGETAAGVVFAALRERRMRMLRASAGGMQARVVAALERMAERALASDFDAFGLVSVSDGEGRAALLSLRGTLASFTRRRLWALIDSEGVRGFDAGPQVILHVIAANTPLLAWGTVARALLIGSASVVRLPSDTPVVAAWTDVFLNALRGADGDLADLCEVVRWSSDDVSATQAFCSEADTVVAYGSDKTVAALRRLTPPGTSFLGYGSRWSFGVVLAGADLTEAAAGASTDIAVFDQQGCLSPQFVFVQEKSDELNNFAALLCLALRRRERLLPLRSMSDAQRIREALAVARLRSGTRVETGEGLAWSVLAGNALDFDTASTPGLVQLAPWPGWAALRALFAEAGLIDRLQGVSIAARSEREFQRAGAVLAADFGVTYLCRPGLLQMPPLSWREDGQAVLSSLL